MPVRFLAAMLVILSMQAAMAAESPRVVSFTYAGQVNGLQPGQKVSLWLPEPAEEAGQRVKLVEISLPEKPQWNEESATHNRMIYVEPAADRDGVVRFSVTYQITREEVGEAERPEHLDAAAFLAADKLVPLGGKPTEKLLAGQPMPNDSIALAHLLFDVVDDHMQYRKDKPGYGRGDAVWACESGFGNCTDFHSLFISLARTQHLPAKFEIGFPLPEKAGEGEIGGYHCWAFVMPAGHGWIPVDISEANKHPELRAYFFGHLDCNRVGFTTGRDLALVPQQAGPPLNYFINPYAEVDGHPVAAEQITLHCRYADLPRAAASQPSAAGPTP